MQAHDRHETVRFINTAQAKLPDGKSLRFPYDESKLTEHKGTHIGG